MTCCDRSLQRVRCLSQQCCSGCRGDAAAAAWWHQTASAVLNATFYKSCSTLITLRFDLSHLRIHLDGSGLEINEEVTSK